MKQQWSIGIFTVITMLAMVGFVGYLLFSPVSTDTDTDRDVGTPLSSEAILTLINKERTDRDIEPLKSDPYVTLSAQLKADHMEDNNYHTHNISDQSYTLTTEMHEAVQQSCKDGHSTENLATHIPSDTSSEVIVDGWMASKAHREAILNPEYDTTGLALSSGQINAVQHFCVAK